MQDALASGSTAHWTASQEVSEYGSGRVISPTRVQRVWDTNDITPAQIPLKLSSDQTSKKNSGTPLGYIWWSNRPGIAPCTAIQTN